MQILSSLEQLLLLIGMEEGENRRGIPDNACDLQEKALLVEHDRLILAAWRVRDDEESAGAFVTLGAIAEAAIEQTKAEGLDSGKVSIQLALLRDLDGLLPLVKWRPKRSLEDPLQIRYPLRVLQHVIESDDADAAVEVLGVLVEYCATRRES